LKFFLKVTHWGTHPHTRMEKKSRTWRASISSGSTEFRLAIVTKKVRVGPKWADLSRGCHWGIGSYEHWLRGKLRRGCSKKIRRVDSVKVCHFTVSWERKKPGHWFFFLTIM
jgi:hypothetical protein